VLVTNPGAELYGSDRMALETVRALQDAGLTVEVALGGAGPLHEMLDEAGAETVICPTAILRKSVLSPRGAVGMARDALRAIPAMWRLLRSTRPSMVVVNTLTTPLWLLLGRLSGAHTVCHVHEGEASARAAVRLALYLPLLLAHRIVVNSQYSMDVMVRSAPWLRRRATVVHNAVAGPPSVVPPRPAVGRPVRLLFIGRLSERKGPHVAVEALAVLRARGVDARLGLLGAVFPGNEAYEERLRRQVVRLGLAERIDFLGFRPSVWEAVAAADVVLVPSVLDEPFGNTAVEAGLAARPVVLSDTSGLREASRHSEAATRVPPGDAEAIATAVQGLLSQWETTSRSALRDARVLADRFSSRTYAASLLQAVGSGASRPGLPAPGAEAPSPVRAGDR
jgi:glycosyltransferase involved in cell wall biosynthesis